MKHANKPFIEMMNSFSDFCGQSQELLENFKTFLKIFFVLKFLQMHTRKIYSIIMEYNHTSHIRLEAVIRKSLRHTILSQLHVIGSLVTS